MLATSIEMQVTRDRAEMVIGSSIDDREPETVVFTRPSIVTTMLLLAIGFIGTLQDGMASDCLPFVLAELQVEDAAPLARKMHHHCIPSR
jgi:hypothetical protein